MKAKRTQKKQTQQQHTIYCDSVAGLKYHDFQHCRLKVGERVQLVHERANRFDSDAIRIDTLTGKKLGYIKRTDTAELHEYRRAGIKLTAIIQSINRNNPSWDCLFVKITAEKLLDDSDPTEIPFG